MGLSYYFKFNASAAKSADELETFLKIVEKEARRLGFGPTMVLNAEFKTADHGQFARRFSSGQEFTSDRLKGVALLEENQVFSHDPIVGTCRIIPERGVVLIATDEQKLESVFGFLRFPSALLDRNGRRIVETGLGSWTFCDHIKTSDPRYRKIVEMFAKAGYVEEVIDDYLQ